MQTHTSLLVPVVQFWKQFDLDTKRLTLDSQAVEIQDSKEKCLKSRKKLAESTKVFRKANTEEKLSLAGPLVRAYQEEIDVLTKRSKFSESAFFNLYKSLYEAPDPVPALESLMQDQIAAVKCQTEAQEAATVAELNDKIRALESQLEAYSKEFVGLKNQDITIRQLQEKIRHYEATQDETIEEQVQERLDIFRQELETQTIAATQKQQEAEVQANQMKTKLLDSQARLDSMQSELFELRQKHEEEFLSRQNEVDLIDREAREVTRLNLENVELRKKLSALDEKLASFDIQEKADQERANLQVLKSQLEHKEITIDELRTENGRLQNELVEVKERLETKLNLKEDQLKSQKKVVDRLYVQLEERPTLEHFQSVQKKLRTLERLRYSIDSPEKNHPQDMAKFEFEAKGDEETEKVLVSRIKHAETQLKKAQDAVQEYEIQVHQLTADLQETKKALSLQTELVGKLEEDIADGLAGNKKAQLLSGVLGSQVDATQDTLEANDPAMVSIIKSQRDRFRERIKDLEMEKEAEIQKANQYRSSLKRLEGDNVDLYQKLRYLESYKGAQGGKIKKVAPNNYTLEEGMASEQRYKNIYDEKMNPFAQFNKLESQQRYTELNPIDKVLLNGAKIFLGHKIMRAIAFTYIVMLHCLVGSTLYLFMHSCGISNS